VSPAVATDGSSFATKNEGKTADEERRCSPNSLIVTYQGIVYRPGPKRIKCVPSSIVQDKQLSHKARQDVKLNQAWSQVWMQCGLALFRIKFQIARSCFYFLYFPRYCFYFLSFPRSCFYFLYFPVPLLPLSEMIGRTGWAIKKHFLGSSPVA
jgi:hypothetical protein